MKKCFDNIKILDLARMKDRWEATHMNSAEGEKVEFKGIVRLEGVVEVRGEGLSGSRESWRYVGRDCQARGSRGDVWGGIVRLEGVVEVRGEGLSGSRESWRYVGRDCQARGCRGGTWSEAPV